MKKTYGNRLDRLLAAERNRCLHIRGTQGLEHIALVVHPLAHLQAQVAWDKRDRLGVEQVVKIRAVPPPDFEDIAKTERGDEGRLGPLTLGERINDDGGTVNEETGGGRVHP